MSSPGNARRGLLARRLGSAVVALSIFLCLPHEARAWGVEGHEVTALIAERLLTPKARERLAVILALEPGATLSSISNWADQTRNARPHPGTTSICRETLTASIRRPAIAPTGSASFQHFKTNRFAWRAPPHRWRTSSKH